MKDPNKRAKLFKTITDNNNPLSKLIEINHKTKYQSKLVHSLIQTVCNQIELTKDDLLDAILIEPTRETFVYTILFDDSFIDIPIRNELLRQLIGMWEEWEKRDCQVAETQAWSRLKNEQRQVVYDIWKRTGEMTKIEISFK